MRGNNFLDKMELADLVYVESADAIPKRKKNGWLKWGAIAACFSMVVLAGVLMLDTNNTSPVFVGGIAREYKDVHVMGSESAIEWPWEYKTLSEQYTTVMYDGKEYTSSGRTVDDALIGDSLGTYDVEGYDSYTEQKYQMKAEIFRNSGISEERIVAVKLGDEYYSFAHNEYDPPATFGEVLDEYNLGEVLGFNRFTVYDGHTNNGHFSLDNDSYIWEILNKCRDAEYMQDDAWNRGDKKYLSFTATSDALGVYKRVFYVSEDGYIWTNIFGYAYIFQIGVDATKKIISYATENGIEAEAEPYTYTLAGTITEISGGYVFVDDSILCTNESDGLVFKIPMNDLRISRCIDFEKIGVGNVVVVYFTGTIDADSGNIVEGAYSLAKGTLSDGGVSVPE